MVDFNVKKKPIDVEKLMDTAEVPVKVEFRETRLKNMFKRAEEAIDLMCQTADEFKVTSVDSREKAIEMGTQARQIFNRIEKARKEFKKPVLEIGQSIDGLINPLKKKLDGLGTGLKKKIKVHVDAEATRHREQERKRMEVEAALNPEIEAPKSIPSGKAVIPLKQETSSGSMAVNKVWKFKLTDITAVPSKFLLLNEDAVKVAIELGTREIPGVEIYEDSDIRLTVSRKGGPFHGK